VHIADLLSDSRIALNLRVRDKRALLAALARLAAAQAPGLSPEAIEAALQARERLGSTGLGAGFALPHARLDHLEGFLGLFVRLARPIAFEAIDGEPVDTIFLLLIPATDEEHVSVLAAISRRFRDPRVRVELRAATSAAEVLRILTQR
jgi:PTS system nitrogen regulatory IIA component